MFQFPAFASYPYVFESKIPYNNAWKPLLFVLTAEALRTAHRITGDGLWPCEASASINQKPTEQISQAFKVGFPIRRSMDQSSFAAPHGFSQRITSFIACACQGIHQMPLRHLIVLIANAHHLAARSPKETATDRVTFYNPVNPTMPSTCST